MDWLSSEELSAIFGAIQEAEMRRLRAENEQLKAAVAQAREAFDDERKRIHEGEMMRRDRERDRQG